MADSDSPGVARWIRRVGVALPVLAVAALVATSLVGTWWRMVAFFVWMIVALAWIVNVEAREAHISFREALRAQWRRATTKSPKRG